MNSDMNADQFENGLDYFLTHIGSDINPMAIKTFLYIARHDNCTQDSLGQHLGLSVAARSRQVAYWSDKRFDGRPGPDFVERLINREDGRYRALALNAAGKKFYQGFLKSLPKKRTAKPQAFERGKFEENGASE